MLQAYRFERGVRMRQSALVMAVAAALCSAPAASVHALSAETPATNAAQRSVRPSDESRKALAAAQARLAWRLIEGAAPGADVTVSPAGLASLFAVLSEGADAKLKAAMVKALGFEGKDWRTALAALKEARAAVASADPAVFVSRDRLVFAPGEAPGELAAKGMDALGVPYVVADLTKADEIKKIDDWVKATTGGMIPEILGQPLQAPSFVALNALHFKAKWKTPFDSRLTAETSFIGADHKSGPVEMMRLPEAERAYRAEAGFIGVELPFDDMRYSLVVVASSGAPKTAKEFATAASWLSGEGFAPRNGDLALPRFSLEGSANLMPALAKAGLAEGLKSPTALAGFAPDVTLQQILQRATIEVDEEGTEAAAATAAIVTRSLAVDDTLHMVVDKPFIYALRDRDSGLILVAGYVGRPPRGRAV
jgi:serine protease inhibitor